MNIATLCRFISIVLVLFLASTASAQINTDCTSNESWTPVGTGLPGEALLSIEMEGALYVLHRATGDPQNTTAYGLSKWDGATWSTVTMFHAVRGDHLGLGQRGAFFCLEVYDGMLYLGGTFSSIDGDTALAALVKWDGKQWTPAHDGMYIRNVSALEVYKDELYATIEITNHQWRVIRWNGNIWEEAGDLPESTKQTNVVLRTIKSWNGNLYLGGTEPTPGATVIIMKWDGSTWTSIHNGYYGYIYTFFIYRDHLYACGGLSSPPGERRMLIRWDGTSWEEDFPDLIGYYASGAEFAVHGDQIYMLSGADPLTTGLAFVRVGRFDGTAWHIVSNTNAAVNTLVTFNGSLFLGGNFTESCGTPLAYIATLCNDQNCARINGTVFNDANGNCIQDYGEKGLPHRLVALSPGEQFAITNEDGRYSRHTDPGTYTVSLVPRHNWQQVCPSGSGTRTVEIATGTSMGSDFGTQVIPNIRDIRVSITAGRARQGRDLIYAITYENAGTETMSGTIRFIHDPILSHHLANPSETRHSKPVVEWDFTNLRMEESRTIYVFAKVPIETPMQTVICSRVEVDQQQGSLGIHTRDSICVPVTGGYDPNDIQVMPFGLEDDGVITPEDSVLTYQVRFQNTGNDTAFKVVVVDTLSNALDISSIRLGAASHPYSFSIDKSNALVWTFNDIMLPDSNASEPNSHGFFKFSVKLKPNLPYGTKIPNQVHIYFDYNAPVATNTVVSTISMPMGVDDPGADMKGRAVHPNPARETVTVTAEMTYGSLVEVRDVLGRTMLRGTYDGGTMILDIRSLPAGTYFVRIPARDRTIFQQVSVVR